MTLDIGIVGLGWMGQDLASAVADLPDGRVSGGVDPNPDARSRFASTFDCPTYERLTELCTSTGLDGIMISSPHESHYDHTATAIEHRLNVLVEKPFVLDPANGTALVNAAADAGCVLQVGYQRRFHPGFQAVRDRIEAGDIGDLRMISAQLGQAWYETNRDGWRAHPERAGGGILFDTGSHLLAALMWLGDLTPQAVTATGLQTEHGADIDVALSVEYTHCGRPLVGSIGLCGESTDFYPDEVVTMWGSDGRLRFEKDVRMNGPNERLVTVSQSNEASIESFRNVGHEVLTRRKVENFLRSVRGDESPRVDGTFALAVAALRQAAVESFDTSARVSIDLDRFTVD